MSQQPVQIGTEVRRLAATTDYTNGRLGRVIEINEEARRYRVLWHTERSGKPVMNGQRTEGVRTWVKFEAVEVL